MVLNEGYVFPVTQPSGGDDIFVATFTDENVWLVHCDKSYEEIKDAIVSGKNIIGRFRNQRTSIVYCDNPQVNTPIQFVFIYMEADDEAEKGRAIFTWMDLTSENEITWRDYDAELFPY